MTFRDIMKYIESEYNIISQTPCEICGADYVTEEIEIAIIDNLPFDVCSCVCSNCGNERIFEFNAPFIEQNKKNKLINRRLN